MATIERIAREAGVSRTTVSRACNGHPYVRDEVRRRVFDAARRLDYRPNVAILRDSVAVIVESSYLEDLSRNLFASVLLTELCRQMIRRRLRFDLFTTAGIGAMLPGFFRGAILFSHLPEAAVAARAIRGLPVVGINFPLPGIPTVYSDHRQGVAGAVDYLAQRGHRRIGLVIRAADKAVNRRWVSGYRASLAARGLPDEDRLLQALHGTTPGQALARLLRGGPTAIVVGGENNAHPCLHALDTLGVRIPADVSVITFEFPDVSEHFAPPGTTVAQDFAGMAERAMALLLDAPAGPGGNRASVAVPFRLIERASVTTIAAAATAGAGG